MARPKQTVGSALSRFVHKAKDTTQEEGAGPDPAKTSCDEHHEDGDTELGQPEAWLEDSVMDYIDDDEAQFTGLKPSSSVTLQGTESEAPSASTRGDSDFSLYAPSNYIPPQVRKDFGKHGEVGEDFQIKRGGGEEPEGAAHEFACTACGHTVPISKVRKHPQLGIGVCKGCKWFLFSSPFTKDPTSGSENECRWCGDGGDVILCDTCDKSFCKLCIVRNFGSQELNVIVSRVEWRCFFCNPNPLRELIRKFDEVENLVLSMGTSHDSDEPLSSSRKAQKPKRRRLGTRGRNTWNSYQPSPDDTIHTIIARAKEEMKRKSPGTNWTGFGSDARTENIAPCNNAHLMDCSKGGAQSRSSSRTLEENLRQPLSIATTYRRPHQIKQERQRAAQKIEEATTESLEMFLSPKQESELQGDESFPRKQWSQW